jgi:hypothetical protein
MKSDQYRAQVDLCISRAAAAVTLEDRDKYLDQALSLLRTATGQVERAGTPDSASPLPVSIKTINGRPAGVLYARYSKRSAHR